MNIVILVGNIGKDPTLKQAGESKVCRFSLAVPTRANEPPIWINCEAWDSSGYQLASLIAQHCRKGKKITVMGELRESRYESDGVTKKVTFVRVGNAQWDKSASTQPAANAEPDEQW